MPESDGPLDQRHHPVEDGPRQCSDRDFRPLTLTGVQVGPNRLTSLKPQTLQPAGEVIQLEPFVVKASANRVWPGGHDYGVLPLRVAAGNLDLPRSADDALAFAPQ